MSAHKFCILIALLFIFFWRCQGDDDDNAAARRKAAADQELSLTLSESKKTAELQLKEACDWLVCFYYPCFLHVG